MSIYLIAEIGPNHNGSLDTALKMIEALAESGTDAIKFQLAVPENVYSEDAFKADYQKKNDGAGSPIEMSRRIQLSFDDHIVLHDRCENLGVDYLCTAFDTESLKFLDERFNMPYFKIPSGEILSVDILEYAASRNLPILLSTGMATFDEIDFALGVLEKHGPQDITILHCISNYPAPFESINLNVMENLRQTFNRAIGYSDHSLGIECCLGAVAMGATVIEKHVTTDKNLAGPDHKASATIDEYSEMVTSIRNLETALGTGDKIFSHAELAIRDVARKSIVAKRDIAVGEKLRLEDICFKRPGSGISPNELGKVIDKTTICPIKANRLIQFDNLK
jgi:N,N'-diacetyllegionaminate synthase